MKRNFTYALTGLVCLLVVMSSISSTMAATAQYFPEAGTQSKYRVTNVFVYDDELVMENKYNVYNHTLLNRTTAFPVWFIENLDVNLTDYISIVNDTTIDLVICYSEATSTTLYRYAKVIYTDHVQTYGLFEVIIWYANFTDAPRQQWYTHAKTTHDKSNFITGSFHNILDYFDNTLVPGAKIHPSLTNTVFTHTPDHIISTRVFASGSFFTNYTYTADRSGRVINYNFISTDKPSRYTGFTWFAFNFDLIVPSGGGLDIPGYDIFAIFGALIIGFGAIYAFSLKRKSRIN